MDVLAHQEAPGLDPLKNAPVILSWGSNSEITTLGERFKQHFKVPDSQIADLVVFRGTDPTLDEDFANLPAALTVSVSTTACAQSTIENVHIVAKGAAASRLLESDQAEELSAEDQKAPSAVLVSVRGDRGFTGYMAVNPANAKKVAPLLILRSAELPSRPARPEETPVTCDRFQGDPAAAPDVSGLRASATTPGAYVYTDPRGRHWELEALSAQRWIMATRFENDEESANDRFNEVLTDLTAAGNTLNSLNEVSSRSKEGAARTTREAIFGFKDGSTEILSLSSPEDDSSGKKLLLSLAVKGFDSTPVAMARPDLNAPGYPQFDPTPDPAAEPDDYGRRQYTMPSTIRTPQEFYMWEYTTFAWFRNREHHNYARGLAAWLEHNPAPRYPGEGRLPGDRPERGSGRSFGQATPKLASTYTSSMFGGNPNTRVPRTAVPAVMPTARGSEPVERPLGVRNTTIGTVRPAVSAHPLPRVVGPSPVHRHP